MLRELYNLPEREEGSNSDWNSQAVIEWENQYYNSADLKQFFSQYNIQSDPLLVYVSGANDQALPGGEAALDIQWIMAVSPNTRTQFRVYPGTQDLFINWMVDVASQEWPAVVQSVRLTLFIGFPSLYTGELWVTRGDVGELFW